MIVDASSGAPLDQYELHQNVTGTGNGVTVGQVSIETTQTAGGYTLTDPAHGGTIVYDSYNSPQSNPRQNARAFSKATNSWGNGTTSSRESAAVDASYGLAKTWDYYKNSFNRSGIRNDGRGARAYVHVDTTTSYNGDGTLSAVGFPAAGSQPAMALAFTYEAQTLRPIAVSGSQGLAATTTYSLTGKPLQHEFSHNGSKKIWATNTYEWGTQRLATARVDRQDVPGVDRHDTYRYDQAGNILAVSDVSRSGTDNQCFTYDHLRRLTTAWTQPVATCATEPSGTTVGGPAPYWHSYTYDATGNRTGETIHDLTGNTAKDTKRTYAYPSPGAPRPHAVTAVNQTGPGGTAQDTYGYDALGNTEHRTIAGTTQRLTWDPEGRLAKVTKPVEGAPDDVTEYLYDADGNRLIARTAKETTLYLGASRVTLAKGATTAKVTRVADLGEGHQAVIEDDGSVSFTLADHLGTGELSIKAANQQLTQRRSLPFGGVRGTAPATWPGAQGFVGGEDDSASTGLQHLGAREYDPALGRFISVDPLLAPTDPQSLNGYAYANNSPLTYSDPDGLRCIHGSPGGGPDGICAGVPGDTDGVIDGTSNNCPTSATSCNQTAAVMAEEAKRSGTYGKKRTQTYGQKPIVIVAKNDSITIQGVYIPTQTELAEVFPVLLRPHLLREQPAALGTRHALWGPGPGRLRFLPGHRETGVVRTHRRPRNP
ncbi:RHS repeat-associated core domain-containing protein [Streptomyces roseolus]|uniref:RHS repeat-associated core domain-containing protein n=1 Tax=Streptomyces roseolus TaxID=67358 RepID=UPI0036E3246E